MRCFNCGREIKNGLNYCPGCGVAVSITQANADIQSKLGVEVDRMMGTSDNLRNIHDGVEIIAGSMEVTDPDAADESIFAAREPEEVTEETVREDIRADFEELDLTEDYEDVQVVNIVREIPDEEEDYPEEVLKEDAPVHSVYAAVSSESNENDKKGRKTDIFLVIIIIIIALAAVGYIVFGLLLKDAEHEPQIESQTTVPAEQTTSAGTVNDVITCSVEEGGEYEPPLKITLSSKRGFRMYYTLDGEDADMNSSMYNGSFTLKERDMDSDSQEYTLNICSFTVSGKKAGTLKVSFKLTKADVSAPVITPESGSYNDAQLITIAAQPGVSIYYIYGGGEGEPDESSTLYEGPLQMKRGSSVLKAVAIKDGRRSDVTSAVFNLNIPERYNYDQSFSMLKKELIDKEIMDEDGLTADGGSVFTGGNGKAVIDEESYFCFVVSIYDKDGKKSSEDYYGVNDRTGTVVMLEKMTDGSFAVSTDD